MKAFLIALVACVGFLVPAKAEAIGFLARRGVIARQQAVIRHQQPVLAAQAGLSSRLVVSPLIVRRQAIPLQSQAVIVGGFNSGFVQPLRQQVIVQPLGGNCAGFFR